MRTTIDLPTELMRAARTRAAERDESLKELFARAVAHEVGLPVSRREGTRVVLPLLGRGAEPTKNVTNADIEAALASEDSEKYGNQ